jgi:hypothetical protein
MDCLVLNTIKKPLANATVENSGVADYVIVKEAFVSSMSVIGLIFVLVWKADGVSFVLRAIRGFIVPISSNKPNLPRVLRVQIGYSD